jgi:2'-5' RNA ligase
VARDRSSRPEATPLRLFIAVDVPDDVKAGVREAIEPFRSTTSPVRWTAPEGWHVTLKFLGATWPRLVDEVRQAIQAVASATTRFETELGDLGTFPRPNRARVLWVGLTDSDGRFASMVRQLDERLLEHFRAEKRDFTPHLTLGRLNPPANLHDASPELLAVSVSSPRFAVEELVLYRSHLSPRGARYEAVERFPLRAAGP